MNDLSDIELNPPARDELPLVTFALFAFNQEKYIRAAVEAALAQTYSPLEIIFSDDCSSDRTYQIMCEMVANYKGPHRVRVLQTDSNIGTFAHVMNSVRLSAGKLLVLAAGDDVSMPNRVGVLVEAWRATKAWGLYSKFDRIDGFGAVQEVGCYLPMPNNALRSYFPKGSKIELIHGATSAYDRRLFELVSGFEDLRVLQEDAVLSFILNMNQLRIEFIDSSLVSYRSHENSISNRGKSDSKPSADEVVASELRASRFSRSLRDLNVLLLRILDSSLSSGSISLEVDRGAMIRDQMYFDMKSDWSTCGAMSRFSFLLSPGCSGRRSWLIPRLFGMQFFARLKAIVEPLRR